MRANAALFLLLPMTFSVCNVAAQETGNAVSARHITLQEAVQLALKHNHDVRIAGYAVDEKQHAKEVA